MFKSPTALIVGAGASNEFEMPLGTQLANTVRYKMELTREHVAGTRGLNDKQLLVAVHNHTGYDVKALLGAARRLREGLPLRRSIDDFLDIHRNDEVLVTFGKAAIVKSILEAERRSTLARVRLGPTGNAFDSNMGIDFNLNSNTWLAKFVKMLGSSGPEAIIQNLTIVNFNYDRTIEFFLVEAMKALYGYDNKRAIDLVGQIKIFHPYGTVGNDPLEKLISTFGAPVLDASCAERAHLIRTYTEEVDSKAAAEMHGALSGMKRLIFLGFGFHEQNIRLLTPPDLLPARPVYATTEGVREMDEPALKNRIGSMFRNNIRPALFAGTCASLFDSYALTFSQM